jgi:hypothetical protein
MIRSPGKKKGGWTDEIKKTYRRGILSIDTAGPYKYSENFQLLLQGRKPQFSTPPPSNQILANEVHGRNPVFLMRGRIGIISTILCLIPRGSSGSYPVMSLAANMRVQGRGTDHERS